MLLTVPVFYPIVQALGFDDDKSGSVSVHRASRSIEELA